MQTMTGKTEGKHSALLEVLAMETGERVAVHGLVHTLRDLGDVRFALLRMPQGVLQCVLGADEDVRDGDAVEISGEVVRDERASGGAELHAQSVKVLSRAAEAMPVPISKNKMNLSLDTDLALRFVTLRNLRKRAVFKIQEGIVRGFREALQKEGFTEIHSPKIVAQNAEGGANLFRMEYFGRRAYLAQSPQFYKQAMVPVYERVFEIGPVFRAEKHNTQRHLNEYTSIGCAVIPNASLTAMPMRRSPTSSATILSFILFPLHIFGKIELNQLFQQLVTVNPAYQRTCVLISGDISRIAADEIADNLRNRIISLCGQRVIYAKQDRLRILRVFADGFKVLCSHFRIDHGIRPLP